MCTLMTYFCHAIHRQWLVEKGSGGDSRWSRSTAVLLAKSLAGEDAVARENLICSLEARTHGAAFCQVCVSISSLNVLRHTHTHKHVHCTHVHICTCTYCWLILIVQAQVLWSFERGLVWVAGLDFSFLCISQHFQTDKMPDLSGTKDAFSFRLRWWKVLLRFLLAEQMFGFCANDLR